MAKRMRQVFATIPANMARQLGPWRVCRVNIDGSMTVLETFSDRSAAIAREMQLRREQEVTP